MIFIFVFWLKLFHLAAGLKLRPCPRLLMCLLLNVAPPPACLLFEDPTFSHILSLVSVGQSSIPPPPLPVFSFTGLWDCNLFTSSPVFSISSLSSSFFACGLLVPPSPPLRKRASPQFDRRKLQSTQKHSCRQQKENRKGCQMFSGFLSFICCHCFNNINQSVSRYN